VDYITNKEYYSNLGLNELEIFKYCNLNNKPKDKDEEEYKKQWLKKPKQNFHKQPILTLRTKTNKAHQGIIDKTRPYQSEWCLIDTDNNFTYKNKIYTLNKCLEQYQGRVVILNPKARKSAKITETIYDMDKIWVLEQDGNTYYYDMNIEKIDNNMITLVK
jgi:hypothetical protein